MTSVRSRAQRKARRLPAETHAGGLDAASSKWWCRVCGTRWFAAAAVAYVFAVLLSDALASMNVRWPMDWGWVEYELSYSIPATPIIFSETGEEIISGPPHLRHRLVRVFYFDF